MEIIGQFRSVNKKDEQGKGHLILNLFVTAVQICGEGVIYGNIIYIDGYLCKKPSYRLTPFGREVSDLLIAVNRNYGQSDYIPCIAWGRTARWTSTMDVGDRIEIYGRIQSRQYTKKQISENGEEEVLEKEAYEISTVKLNKVASKK